MERQTRVYVPVFVAAAALGLILSGFILLIILEGHAREAEREHARLVLCQEIEKLKTIEREDLTVKIRDGKKFLRENPGGIPGIPPELIRRGIRNNENKKLALAPLAGGCVAFSKFKNDTKGEP